MIPTSRRIRVFIRDPQPLRTSPKVRPTTPPRQEGEIRCRPINALDATDTEKRLVARAGSTQARLGRISIQS